VASVAALALSKGRKPLALIVTPIEEVLRLPASDSFKLGWLECMLANLKWLKS
jgi:hypothetical protein